MTAFTSKADGNWSASGQTTWTQVGVPGNGDTVTISHNVNVDVDTTIGASPAAGSGTAAILMNTASKLLTVKAGKTLTCRGDYTRGANGAQLVLEQGAIFEFDASQAGTPATALYKINSNGHNLTGVTLVCNGVLGTRCTVRSNAGGGNGNLVTGFLQGNGVTAAYTDFLRIGDASNNAIGIWPSTSGVHLQLTNYTFTSCGGINLVSGTFVSGCNCQIEDGTWASTATSYCVGANMACAGSGTRSIKRNGFDKDLGTGGGGGQWTGLAIENNAMLRFYQLNASTVPTSFRSNFLWINSNGAITWYLSTAQSDRNYLLFHNSSQITNQHGLTPNTTSLNIYGFIMEPGNTDSSGDYILPGSTATGNVRWNLLLPTKDSVESGQFVSLGGGSGSVWAVEHNTYVASSDSGENGGISYGETYAGIAGMLSSIKSNLVWSPNGAGVVFSRRSNRTVADACAAANITYNGKYNLSAGNQSVNGYSDYGTTGTFTAMFSTGTPGANDITANPNFVDSTRRISTWALARGYTSSSTYNTMVNDAFMALLADPSNRVLDLIAWVDAGWHPMNPIYRNAGHDGVTTGALEYTTTLPALERGVRGVNRGLYAGAA